MKNLGSKESTALMDHVPGKLSDLETQMAIHIPPGGNWENIPTNIPSDRLSQIRRMSETRGKCRTTYYGRLAPDRPAYTVNTYFSRIGNGTFLHYDMAQTRLITQREAARLQSFPDSFLFSGSFTSRFRQIGNAVPPFLVFCIVNEKLTGCKVVDLFCGAGGLSLGLSWARSEIIAGIDTDRNSIQTFKDNHPNAIGVLGDLTEDTTKQRIMDLAKGVDLVVGGPPCQGFSQAGWFKRDDKRNFLFKDFLEVLDGISPPHFIMENVQGILWMDKGNALKSILKKFRDLGYTVDLFTLSAEKYGVPQMRKRVFIVGTTGGQPIQAPKPICADNLMFHHSLVTVKEALGDLPPIIHGQAICNNYICEPENAYQKFMRGILSPDEYLEILMK